MVGGGDVYIATSSRSESLRDLRYADPKKIETFKFHLDNIANLGYRPSPCILPKGVNTK